MTNYIVTKRLPDHHYFVRPKQAFAMLAMSRSTFYRFMKEKKVEGFPQIHKLCGMSVIRLDDIVAYQNKICGITKSG